MSLKLDFTLSVISYDLNRENLLMSSSNLTQHFMFGLYLHLVFQGVEAAAQQEAKASVVVETKAPAALWAEERSPPQAEEARAVAVAAAGPTPAPAAEANRSTPPAAA